MLDGQEEREAVCGVGRAVGRERRSEAGAAEGGGGRGWRRRACRGARSLRLWPVGGGRKARRGEVAVAEPWVGVDSSKPPRLYATIAAVRRACHAGAAKRRGGGSFTHPRRPRRRLAEDGKIQLSTFNIIPPPLVEERYACGLWSRGAVSRMTANITRLLVTFM